MDAAKKLLVICEAFYPEDFLINDLVHEWEKNNYQFEVLTRAPSYPYGKVYDGYKNKLYQITYFNSIKIHRFPVLQGYEKSTIVKILNYFSFVFWSCLTIFFIGRRFDRIFIYQTGPLTLATAGIIHKKLFKSKITIWTQDLWPETVYAYGFKKTKILSYFLDKFVKWIYLNCDNILVSCEGFKERIRRFVPEKKISFIPNWSLLEYAPKMNIKLPGKYNFTFAGNIGKVQNLENILKGFNLFVKQYPDTCLNIIGDGSALQNLKHLTETNLIENVNFTGRKQLSEMSDYYKASDVLILSLKDVPLYEIMIPSKFQAYLSTGKPLFAVICGEVRTLVEKYEIGIGANPSDINDIANGFCKFMKLADTEKARMAHNCHLLNKNVFDRNKIIADIDSIVWK